LDKKVHINFDKSYVISRTQDPDFGFGPDPTWRRSALLACFLGRPTGRPEDRKFYP